MRVEVLPLGAKAEGRSRIESGEVSKPGPAVGQSKPSRDWGSCPQCNFAQDVENLTTC
jgi:hypothetical protein